MPKKATKPKRKRLSERELKMRVRKLEFALEIADRKLMEAREDNVELTAADEEKLVKLREAAALLLDSREEATRLRDRNKRLRNWNAHQRTQIELLAVSMYASITELEVFDAEIITLKAERKKYELASTILGYIFTSTPDGFTHEDRILHVMHVAEFLGVNFLEVADAVQEALVFGYSVTIPQTMQRLINEELQGS